MFVLFVIESLFVRMSNVRFRKYVNDLKCGLSKHKDTITHRVKKKKRKSLAVIYRLTEWDVIVSHVTWLAFNTVLRAVITCARWLLTSAGWAATHTLTDTNKRRGWGVSSGLSSPLLSLPLSSQVLLVKSHDPLTQPHPLPHPALLPSELCRGTKPDQQGFSDGCGSTGVGSFDEFSATCQKKKEKKVRRRMKNESRRSTIKINEGRNIRNLMCSKTTYIVMKALFP